MFTDPKPVEVTLGGMPKMNMVSVKSSKWNLGKPGGWDVYQELTNNASKEIKDVVFNDELGIDEVMKKIETIEKDVKFAAFGKTRINQNKANKK